jgi:hypothetical protein
LPEIFDERTIYVIGKPEPWLVAFNCPCGCNSIIQLNLLQNAKPKWRLLENSKGRITISPSVWRTEGCKSHFFVRKSKIDWVGSRRKVKRKKLVPEKNYN